MDTRNEPSSGDNFFLPELCNGQSLGMLVLVGELLAVVLVLAGARYTDDAWIDLGLTSLFVQWITLTSALALCQLRPVLARLPRPVAAGTAFGIIVLDTLVFSIGAWWAYGWTLAPAALGEGPTFESIASNVLIAAIIGGLVLRYLYLQEQLRAKQEAELKARIQALQSRIRPHFLFNSMNIIASLIAVDPDTAETVVEDLAELFRASLRDAGNEVTLEHEIDLCRRYMRIEQLRMGPRLKVEWRLDGVPLRQIRIPLLSLQPLVENAVYHGIQPLAEGGTVVIGARYESGIVTIRVENPVGPEPAGRDPGHRGNRMALENIRHRLAALYGPSASLVSAREDGTYGTTLRYPFNIG